MKAIFQKAYGAAQDVLEIKTMEKPQPQDNQVLVKVLCASVNDWDWGLVTGKPFYIRLFAGLFKPNRIPVPGAEISGTVESCGASVKRFKPGDAVYGDISESGFNGFAEYACVSEQALSIKPQNMNFADAAGTNDTKTDRGLIHHCTPLSCVFILIFMPLNMYRFKGELLAD